MAVTGEPVRFDWLTFQPAQVLYEFDGPRIFTCRDDDGALFLAYQCCEDADEYRLVVVPCSDELLERLTQGELTVLDALNQPDCWLFSLNHDGEPSKATENMNSTRMRNETSEQASGIL